MKKLIALAALAACLPTFAGTVESSNTVGYTKVNLDAGYNMIGVQFVDIGGTAKALATVATLDSSMAGCDDEGNYATKMLVFRNGDYLPDFGWSGTAGTEYFDGEVPDNEWLNLDLEETDDSLDRGDAFWVKAGSAGTITLVGQVPTGTITIPLSAGYNMVANPYPKAVKVSEFGQLAASMAGCDDEGNFATKMLVFKNGDYLPDFGWSGTAGTDYFDGEVPDNKWVNLDLEETNDTVDAGHAVWIKAGSAGSITFTLD
jgi:hypothetical protein